MTGVRLALGAGLLSFNAGAAQHWTPVYNNGKLIGVSNGLAIYPSIPDPDSDASSSPANPTDSKTPAPAPPGPAQENSAPAQSKPVPRPPRRPRDLPDPKFASPDDLYDDQNAAASGCPYADGRCRATQSPSRISPGKIAGDRPETQPFLSQLALRVVSEALRGRPVAAHLCGGGWRSGNRSKCMCASANKDALVGSGACGSRPPGDAIDLRYSLSKYCSVFHKTGGHKASPWNAPAGSVIIYSTTRHRRGHMETKILVTPEILVRFGRALGLGSVKLGQVLYCSDFCRTAPTFSHGTNTVEAIYSL